MVSTKGDKLFWQMAGGDAAAGLWERWQELGRSFPDLWPAKDLPEDLHWSLSWQQREALVALHRDGLPPLLALGVNPFLLVMFAQVYASTGELPQNQGKLFAAFVDTLLGRERQRHPEGWPGAERLAAAYAALAFAMQLSGQRGTAVIKPHIWDPHTGGMHQVEVLWVQGGGDEFLGGCLLLDGGVFLMPSWANLNGQAYMHDPELIWMVPAGEPMRAGITAVCPCPTAVSSSSPGARQIR